MLNTRVAKQAENLFKLCQGQNPITVQIKHLEQSLQLFKHVLINAKLFQIHFNKIFNDLFLPLNRSFDMRFFIFWPSWSIIKNSCGLMNQSSLPLCTESPITLSWISLDIWLVKSVSIVIVGDFQYFWEGDWARLPAGNVFVQKKVIDFQKTSQ